LIVGDVRAGEDRRLFDEFRQLHPKAHLIVTGWISPQDLPSYYSVMDLVVQPSLRDGLPNALLEAMACGKAVIGSAVGGIPDAITDGANGRLVPAGSAEELANVIAELLEDEAQRTQLGSSACQTIRNQFTSQAELEANLIVYRQLGLRT
jgi:glycosyltransferase involved in cell wall biosynthesis